MALQPYQQRVVDEKRELDERRTRLAAFILGDAFGSLPMQERSLLSDQFSAMCEYSRLLGERIKLFTQEAP
jgi:hypothetical protein